MLAIALVVFFFCGYRAPRDDVASLSGYAVVNLYACKILAAQHGNIVIT